MQNHKELCVKDIVSALRRTARVLYLDSRQMVKEIGLSYPQCLVLKAIYANGSFSLAELSRHLSVSPANMTGLIDRLENKRLVKRAPKEGDRRITIVELTERGKMLAQTVPDSIEQKLIDRLEGISADELEMITDAILKIVGLLDAQEVVDEPLDPTPIK